MQSGLYEQAIDAVQQAVQVEPENINLLEYYAVTHTEYGAFRAIDSYLSANPKNFF